MPFYIDKAINLMKLYDLDSIIGVKTDDSLYYKHDGSGLSPIFKNSNLKLERELFYKKVGGLTLTSKKYFMKSNNIIGGKIGHFNMTNLSSYFIGDNNDWRIAESIIKNKIIERDEEF